MVSREAHNLLINARGLTWGYPSSPAILFHKLDFALYKNDFCIITGVSGSGKSTLAKLIMRQYDIQRNMLYHKQDDLSRFSHDEVQKFRQKIGVVFQDYKLIERKTVLENVVYPLSILKSPPQHKSVKLMKIIKLLGLEKLQDAIVRYLSGGEKQKVAIARALVHSPEFIIADEPTGNLDPKSAQQIADHLIDLHAMGNTIMMITHNMDIKRYIASKIQIQEYSLSQ